MKRVNGLFEPVADFGNLYHAYLRARRGKRDRLAVERFTVELEPELLRLRCELLDGSYRPGPFVSFEIEDPKPRIIHAAPFRDRVLHHAIIGVLEPHFERWLDFDSYACRKRKGVDAALRRAVELTRESRLAPREGTASGRTFSANRLHGLPDGDGGAAFTESQMESIVSRRRRL